MEGHIFENLKDFNAFVKGKTPSEFSVQYTSHVVGLKKDQYGIERWEVVDRWFVMSKN